MTLPVHQRIDVRAWLLWGAAASLPLLTGRHPLVLLELLIVVAIVRSVCLPARESRGWGWLVRIATIAVPIGVVFNVMTVHTGNQPIARIPDSLAIIGGVVTWNALVYGLLSGLTIVVLVAIGTTVAAGVEWSAFMRLLPARASTLAVAGSVAWSFLPQLARSWQEIRETQAGRGHQWRGIRDFVPMIVPLLAGGLDRSVATAEALEARGFGALSASEQIRRSHSLILIGALSVAVTGLYLLAVGEMVLSAAVLTACGVMAVGFARASRSGTMMSPTRYRQTQWTTRDSAISAAAAVAIATTTTALQLWPSSLRYDPYPDLDIPYSQPVVALFLASLVLPAIIAPAPVENEVER